MRLGVAMLIAWFLTSCEAASSAPQASPAPAPVPASVQQLLPYYGSYADGSGDVVVVARLGWFFDMKTAAYRTMYATRSPSRFTIGIRFLEPTPKFADLSFSAQ